MSAMLPKTDIARPTRRNGASAPTRPFANALEADQGAHRHAELPALFGAAQIRQIDDEAGCQNIGADLFQQLAGGFGGAAGGDEIVDQVWKAPTPIGGLRFATLFILRKACAGAQAAASLNR
jgi:hypothetical protein